MLPPLPTRGLSSTDVMASRFHMEAPLRRKHGAVNLAEYQADPAVVMVPLLSHSVVLHSFVVNLESEG